MIVPQEAVDKTLALAREYRAKYKLTAEQDITIVIHVGHDWPAEAVVMLANRMREHYIHLEVAFDHRNGDRFSAS